MGPGWCSRRAAAPSKGTSSSRGTSSPLRRRRTFPPPRASRAGSRRSSCGLRERCPRTNTVGSGEWYVTVPKRISRVHRIEPLPTPHSPRVSSLCEDLPRLPGGDVPSDRRRGHRVGVGEIQLPRTRAPGEVARSEEHTSELQSLAYLVCRLLLEKKKHRIGGETARRSVTRHQCPPAEVRRGANGRR